MRVAVQEMNWRESSADAKLWACARTASIAPSLAHRKSSPSASIIILRNIVSVERGDAEICETFPGGEEHLVVVVNDPMAFARWHLGELAWLSALRSGAIAVTGPRQLARALPTWHRDHERGPIPLHGLEPAGREAMAVGTPA